MIFKVLQDRVINSYSFLYIVLAKIFKSIEAERICMIFQHPQLVLNHWLVFEEDHRSAKRVIVRRVSVISVHQITMFTKT